jgi:uncharacterized protein YndB with AHSA1/START domain
MKTVTSIPENTTTIVMSRVYAAPRSIVWAAMTEPAHVRQWWGGPGFTNPVCEMDLRPGGLWKHVMRFPDGVELQLNFVFVDIEAPSRLVWKHVDHGQRREGPPTCVTTVTLEDLGDKTRWQMVAEFSSIADRAAALAIGFTKPIEASTLRLTDYLPRMLAAAEN